MYIHSAKSRLALSIAAAGGASLIALVALSPFSHPDQAARPVSGYSASWAYGYDNVQEMASASDAVVIGEPTASSQFTQGHLIFTDFTFDVSGSFKGVVTEGSIVVMQTGGYDAGSKTTVQIDDDPLFVIGTQYVLFLKYDAPTGKYYVVGGPQGRFSVVAGKLSSLSVIYPDRTILDLGFKGVELTDLTPQIR